MIAAARELVREEVARLWPSCRRYREALSGRRAAVYTGGAFKAFSLVRSLRTLGMQTVLVGSQTGNKENYKLLGDLCDEGTILVDDTNPLELSRFVQEKDVDLFIGGVKERPIAFKLGIGFCDHNHERKEALAGFEGMLNFAREVYRSVNRPFGNWCRETKRTAGEKRKTRRAEKGRNRTAFPFSSLPLPFSLSSPVAERMP